MKLKEAISIVIKELLLARINYYAAFNYKYRGTRKMNI